MKIISKIKKWFCEPTVLEKEFAEEFKKYREQRKIKIEELKQMNEKEILIEIWKKL